MLEMVNAYILRKRFEAQLFVGAIAETAGVPNTQSDQYKRGNSGRLYRVTSANQLTDYAGIKWQ